MVGCRSGHCLRHHSHNVGYAVMNLPLKLLVCLFALGVVVCLFTSGCRLHGRVQCGTVRLTPSETEGIEIALPQGNAGYEMCFLAQSITNADVSEVEAECKVTNLGHDLLRVVDKAGELNLLNRGESITVFSGALRELAGQYYGWRVFSVSSETKADLHMRLDLSAGHLVAPLDLNVIARWDDGL